MVTVTNQKDSDMKTPEYEASGNERKLTYIMKTPETKRTYLFPGGDRIEIENVTEARASRHGNHMLTTLDGTTVVVRDRWLTLTFPTESKVAPKEVVDRGEDNTNRIFPPQVWRATSLKMNEQSKEQAG